MAMGDGVGDGNTIGMKYSDGTQAAPFIAERSWNRTDTRPGTPFRTVKMFVYVVSYYLDKFTPLPMLQGILQPKWLTAMRIHCTDVPIQMLRIFRYKYIRYEKRVVSSLVLHLPGFFGVSLGFRCGAARRPFTIAARTKSRALVF